MSQDRPSAIELLRTLREFTDSLKPRLEGEEQYRAIVSSYLLGILEREFELGTTFDEQERGRLARLLKAGGSLAELERMLCEGIRAGRYDREADWNEVFGIVMEQVINKVRIVRPEHLDPSHRAQSAERKRER